MASNCEYCGVLCENVSRIDYQVHTSNYGQETTIPVPSKTSLCSEICVLAHNKGIVKGNLSLYMDRLIRAISVDQQTPAIRSFVSDSIGLLRGTVELDVFRQTASDLIDEAHSNKDENLLRFACYGQKKAEYLRSTKLQFKVKCP